MKKILYMFLVCLCILLCACDSERKESREIEQKEQEKEEKNKQKEQEKEEGKYIEVVDVTGESRQLKLGEVDVEDNYTVYRDKGEKIVCFEVDADCYVENFVKYEEKFYSFLRSGYDDMVNTLVSIDVATGEVTVVKNMTEETADNGLCGAVIYRDFL